MFIEGEHLEVRNPDWGILRYDESGQVVLQFVCEIRGGARSCARSRHNSPGEEPG
jgi:hypothetical protein